VEIFLSAASGVNENEMEYPDDSWVSVWDED